VPGAQTSSRRAWPGWYPGQLEFSVSVVSSTAPRDVLRNSGQLRTQWFALHWMLAQGLTVSALAAASGMVAVMGGGCVRLGRAGAARIRVSPRDRRRVDEST